MITRRIHRAALFALGLLLILSGTSCRTVKAKPDGEPGSTNMIVERFEIRGVEAFDVGEIKSGLATQQDPGWRTSISWMPLIGADHEYFNRIEWRRDLERIRTFYRTRGYFDAKIASESIVRGPDGERVRIRLQISEGQPTEISEIRVEGEDGLRAEDRRGLLEGLPVKKGKRFVQEDYLRSKSRLLSRLRTRSYAYADVSGRVVITPTDRDAKIVFFIDPGPRATFGEVQIVGNEEIPERFIREAISIDPGDPYSNDALDRAQEDIYALEVFSLVSVLPEHEAEQALSSFREDAASRGDSQEDSQPSESRSDQDEDQDGSAEDQSTTTLPDDGGPASTDIIDQKPDDEDETARDRPPARGPMGISDIVGSAQTSAEQRTTLDPSVPIIVRVKEARMWSAELGVGVSIESNRQDIHGKINWSSRNFLGGLRKLRHFNTVGYAWAFNSQDTNLLRPAFLADPSQIDNQGVVFSSELEFRQPQFFERLTNLRIQPAIRRDVEVGFDYLNPSLAVGIDRTFFRHLTIALNYNLSFYSFNYDASALDPESTPLGVDFQERFLLEYLTQRFTLDYRDSPLNPTRGFQANLQIQEANNYIFGGEFDFLKFVTSIQGYIPFDLGTKWVLALRAELGAIYNIEDPETQDGRSSTRRVPTLNRFYSGGKGQMRGLGRKLISPYRVGSFRISDQFVNRAPPPSDADVVPVGGLTKLELAVEPRFRLVKSLLDVGDLWGAVYYDAATVLSGQFLLQTDANESLGLPVVDEASLMDTLIHSVGAGVWWVTPVGPVRVDFAWTLTPLQNDPRYRTCRRVESVGINSPVETGTADCDYVPLSEDPIQQQLNLDYSFFIGIGHSF
ncbi:MAG: BamA/TamA family outer membrane protein [Myxococcota bacterium]